VNCYTWNRQCMTLPNACGSSVGGSCPETANWFWIFAGVLGAVLLVRGVKK
jgi:hypothetical protein